MSAPTFRIVPWALFSPLKSVSWSAPNLGALYSVPIIGAMEKSTHTKEYDLVRAELKAAREGAGLSQRALAARLDVSHSWIAKVEAGERRIDVVELCWFLNACGKPMPRALAALCGKISMFRVRRNGRSKRG